MQLAAVNDDIPAEADIEMAVCGLKGGREGGGVGHYSRGPKGMYQGGQVLEGYIGEKVGAGGDTRTGYFQVQDGARGDSVGDDAHPNKREGGVQGHRDSRGVVEGVLSCG